MLFKKKDSYIANVTRAAVGKDYKLPTPIDIHLTGQRGTGVAISTLNDKQIEGIPEAAAAMMIIGYCKIKYQAQDLADEKALKELMKSRGYTDSKVDEIMALNDGHLFGLINLTLRIADADYTFEDEELDTFYKNLCVVSPIFKGIKVQ